MKKIYISPTVRVAEMEMETMIAASDPKAYTGDDGSGETPEISNNEDVWSVGSGNNIWDEW